MHHNWPVLRNSQEIICGMLYPWYVQQRQLRLDIYFFVICYPGSFKYVIRVVLLKRGYTWKHIIVVGIPHQLNVSFSLICKIKSLQAESQQTVKSGLKKGLFSTMLTLVSGVGRRDLYSELDGLVLEFFVCTHSRKLINNTTPCPLA